MNRRLQPHLHAATTLQPIQTLSISDPGVAQYLDPSTNSVKGLDPATISSQHPSSFDKIAAAQSLFSVGNADGSQAFYIPFDTPPLIFRAGILRKLTRNSDCYVATINGDRPSDPGSTPVPEKESQVDLVASLRIILFVSLIAATLRVFYMIM
jgi:hypothetical protein